MDGNQQQHVQSLVDSSWSFSGSRYAESRQAVILAFSSTTSTESVMQVKAEKPAAPDFAPQIALIAEHRDRKAFIEVFNYFGPRIKSFLMNRGRNQQSAEDVLQEVMIALWEKSHMYNSDKASVSTWLFTIARYKHIDRLRRDSRHIADSDEPDLRASDDPEAADNVLQDQRAVAVKAAISDLPEDQQTVIVMSFNKGLSHSEIAEQLGLPLGTVKSRIRRAFQRMREELGEVR